MGRPKPAVNCYFCVWNSISNVNSKVKIFNEYNLTFGYRARE